MNKKMSNPVYGFKGFKKTVDGKIMCRDMEYEPGKTYVLGSEPKMCGLGFHFCKKLDDVNTHYRLDDERHVFYIVRASGTIIEDDDATKLVCSTIELVEQVTKEDIGFFKLKKHMELVDKAYTSNPNLIISGSLALILRGVIDVREIGDLDFTLPNYEEMVGVDSENEFGTSGQECNQVNLSNGVGYDLFINPLARWDWIEFDGKKYKVSGIKHIVEAKWRYLLQGKLKHGADLIRFIQLTSEAENFDRYMGKTWSERKFIMSDEMRKPDRVEALVMGTHSSDSLSSVMNTMIRKSGW